MTIREAIALGVETLQAVPDPELDAVALLSDTMGLEPMHLRLSAKESLTQKQEERFRSLLLLRAQREPLQYLLGTRCFYGYDFAVDARVLIPRQETETLCELALERIKGYDAPRVLDVCTGSGAIAVTLKRECEKAAVTATDVSADALDVAMGNALRNHADVRFLQGDLLAPVRGERFDVIVSNPPYIDSATCDTLQPEVMREPRLALDGGTDGLDFYRKFANDAPKCLAGSGHLLMEAGDGQASYVARLLSDTGCFVDVRTHADLYRKERFVSARRAAFPT